MTAREVLVNIKGFDMWEFANYKMSQDEAKVVIEALEEKVQREEKSFRTSRKEQVKR